MFSEYMIADSRGLNGSHGFLKMNRNSSKFMAAVFAFQGLQNIFLSEENGMEMESISRRIKNPRNPFNPRKSAIQSV
jgi:hypothetical protein